MYRTLEFISRSQLLCCCSQFYRRDPHSKPYTMCHKTKHCVCMLCVCEYVCTYLCVSACVYVPLRTELLVDHKSASCIQTKVIQFQTLY